MILSFIFTVFHQIYSLRSVLLRSTQLYALNKCIFCVSFSSMQLSNSPFSFVKIQNPNLKPGFDLVQTRNPGLEKDAQVWNPYYVPCVSKMHPLIFWINHWKINRKHGLCCQPVSVWPYVCLSLLCIVSRWLKITSYLFLGLVAPSFWFFLTLSANTQL